jgi:hypothetical protein
MQFIRGMADDPEKNRSIRVLHHIVVALIVLPLIYILSVGPAIFLVVKVPKLRQPVHTVYAPMIWLHDHTFLKKTMDPYLAFWESAARRLL